jgi:general secretion pathway protein H
MNSRLHTAVLRQSFLPVRSRERGMTLIEMSTALVIVILMFAVAMPTMEAYTGVKAREEAGRISGAIRYLFGASALSGKVCRLVFDMDASGWWAECTEGRFTVDREKERSSGGKRLEEKKKEEESRRFGPQDEGEALKEKVEKKAEFSAYTAEEVPRRQLPDGAELSVWVGHQREKYTKGTAFLYFFPQGHTERAQIYISSGHGDVYTLTVSPLNGKVQVVDRELDLPRD